MCRFGVLLLFLLPALAAAQSAPYNPYAPVREEPPIRADGKLNWPSFFRSAYMESKYQRLFAAGSCTGTRKVITEALRQNKVNVNLLPEVSTAGRVLRVQPGLVMMLDDAQHPVTLVTHPANVTKVHVAGTLAPTALRAGMLVRLRATIDEEGKGTEPVAELEVVNANPDISLEAVEPDKLQTIVGTIARVKHNQLRLNVATGKMHRLSIELAEDATIQVDSNSLALIQAGGEVTAKGLVYEEAGSPPRKTIFASEIEVADSVE
jgi:hypothetical protein